jgi:hypothetical protein
MLTIHSRSNDPNLSFPIRPRRTEEAAGWRNGQWYGSLGSPYGALFLDAILPTQPRWHKGSILLTCDDEIDPQRASGISAAQVGFDDDEVLSLRCSGPKGVL